MSERIALRVVDPDRIELLEDSIIFGELRNDLFTHDLAHFIDRFDRCAADRGTHDIPHKTAVDLDEIDRQLFEVGKTSR